MLNKTDESRISKIAMSMEIEKSTQLYNNLIINDYNLEAVLKDSVKEHTILSAYQFQGELDEKQRNILADVIVHYELRNNINFRITSERAEYIAKKIIKLFPTEEKVSFFELHDMQFYLKNSIMY
ncbi:hypothetical protein ALC62_11188 [Cyphomyrmex costatus]|uniref:Uncharacterized protein n=1 Tax=Cyphomyrmex costatus TaxID=456900 RepID=A0A151ICQ2_9HYME|nr:hypothetical protein ALC62_11188 [Cyphomyrmex costatus]